MGAVAWFGLLNLVLIVVVCAVTWQVRKAALRAHAAAVKAEQAVLDAKQALLDQIEKTRRTLEPRILIVARTVSEAKRRERELKQTTMGRPRYICVSLPMHLLGVLADQVEWCEGWDRQRTPEDILDFQQRVSLATMRGRA